MAAIHDLEDDPTVVGAGGPPPRARATLGDFVDDDDDDDQPTVARTAAFGDEDPTVALSRPARGAPEDPERDDRMVFDAIVRRQARREDDILVVAAEPLLVLVAQLRNAAEFADVEALRKRVTEEIERFEERATKGGVPAGEITAARYALCALIDETVLMTPWGSRSSWSSRSLLSEFHGETWGGEKVFRLLDRVSENPKKYLGILRLLDACLMLGFEGRYRVIEGGREQLEQIRANTGRLIRDQLPDPPETLSPPVPAEPGTRGQRLRRRALRSFLPLWTVFLGAGLLSLSVYLFAWLSIEAGLRGVLARIARLTQLLS